MAFLLACMHQKFKLFLAWERYPLPPLLSSSAISTCSVPQLAALTRFVQLTAFGIVPNLTLLKASLQSKSFHLSRLKCVTYDTSLSIFPKFYDKTWQLYLTPSNEVWNKVGQSGMALNSMDAELWGDTILVVGEPTYSTVPARSQQKAQLCWKQLISSTVAACCTESCKHCIYMWSCVLKMWLHTSVKEKAEMTTDIGWTTS